MTRPVPALSFVVILLLLMTLPLSAHTLAEIAAEISAGTFHAAGYTGTRTLIGNVEAGWTWTGHDALKDGRVRDVPNPFALAGDNTEDHATLVGGTMVAKAIPTGGPGIAYGAQLWSGEIAAFFGSGTSFNISGNSLLYPLMSFGAVGINGSGVVGGSGSRTVDVINSSWGGADNTGNTVVNVIYDYLANARGVTTVCSAGNAGQGAGTVGTPANGWNVISVGASTGTDTGTEIVTSFSSGGPTGSFSLPGSRVKPDILSQGMHIDMPSYNLSDPTAFELAAGTSFSSPTVAGCAALVIDMGKDTGRSTDPRLVKSVLLNSAVKLTGWTQQAATDPTTGTVIDYVPLDESQGAGRVDMKGAFRLYSASNGTGSAPGAVGIAGWNVDTVAQGSPRDYFLSQNVPAGSKLTATLVWFMDRSVSGFDPNAANPFAATTFSNDVFDDLDLYLYKADNNGDPVGNAIAASVSGWNPDNPTAPATGLDSVEHLYLDVPSDGKYVLEVRWTQELFDFVNHANVEDYALSWSVAAFAPGDANHDGLVDSADLAIWQRTYDPLGVNQDTFAMGDWNFDGKIDSADLAIWQENYNPLPSLNELAVGEVAPEPATLFLVAGGLLLVSSVRKKLRVTG